MSGCYKTVGENQTYKRAHLKRPIITSPLIRTPPPPLAPIYRPIYHPSLSHVRTITQIVQNALCVFLWHKQTSLQSSVSSVSVIDLWQCISRQLFRPSCFMVPIRWFLRFTSKTEYVDNFCTAPAIFSAPKRGVLYPQSFVRGAMETPSPLLRRLWICICNRTTCCPVWK